MFKEINLNFQEKFSKKKNYDIIMYQNLFLIVRDQWTMQRYTRERKKKNSLIYTRNSI